MRIVRLTLGAILFIGGIVLTLLPGSILLGMLITCLIGIFLNVVSYSGVIAAIPRMEPTFMNLDIAGAFEAGIITVVFIFFSWMYLIQWAL